MSSISIKQLPRIEEVNTGDLFLIQTPSSSNTLDFKDLIIGLENTTFANTISTFNTNIEILSADVGSLSAGIATNTADINLKAYKNDALLTGDTRADAIIGNESNDSLQLRSDPEAPDGTNGGSQIELYSQDFAPTRSQIYHKARFHTFQDLDGLNTLGIDGENQFIYIYEKTAGALPVGPAPGVGVIFVSGGELKYKGSEGTITTIAPA